MDNDTEYGKLIQERFEKLPKVVQDAITSADVQKHLRELADTQKLHIDQWEKLENEVQLTLLGIQPSEDLVKNIVREVGVPEEVALALAADISGTVFEPIRQELERQLEHPAATAVQLSGAEEMRTQILAETKAERAIPVPATVASLPQTPAPVLTTPTPVPDAQAPAAQMVTAPVPPATPPAPPPVQKAERAPISASYVASQPSHERKSIEGDPYREPVV